MKKIIITLLLLLTIAGFAFAWLQLSQPGRKFSSLHFPNNKEVKNTNALLQKLQAKATNAKSFVKQKGYNSKYCFLIDMSLASGQERFFVYDLEKDTISSSGLVTHGRCNENWLVGRKYGNEPGCGCTSLGKYKTGISYYGRFGLAFKLHGLEKTNDNAFKRFVVLHSHSCVPENEVDTEICQSDGCPTVSPGYLKKLDLLIRQSSKPVLLWIYE